MKRRDLIKFVLLSAIGVAASSIESKASLLTSASDAFAEVKQYNGAPTFFLDGKPTHFSGIWVSSLTPTHWGHKEYSGETCNT